MQQSQKLEAIDYIFTSNKEKELSYSKKYNLIVDDKITNKHFSVIKEKYKGLDNLEGIKFFNFLKNVRLLTYLFYISVRPNLYKETLLSKSFWSSVENGTILKTKFDILDSKVFLNSLLEFIDNEKENLTVHKEQEQISEIQQNINKAKGKFDIFKFPLSYNFSRYLSSYTQYYKTLKLLQKQYNIEDIKIYNGKITFTLSENKNKEILIKFEDDNLYIGGKEVYFQRKNTVIFELIKLLFSYFQNNETNYIEFDNLEKYYKNNKEIYSNLEKAKFNYEYLRKSIETKTKEIEEKHNLNKTFLGIDTSGIICHYLIPENK